MSGTPTANDRGRKTWWREVDWAGSFSAKAKQLRMTVLPEIYTSLEREIKSKNRLIESREQLAVALEAVAEDAAQEARRNGRTEIRMQDFEAALRKCRVYPFCD